VHCGKPGADHDLLGQMIHFECITDHFVETNKQNLKKLSDALQELCEQEAIERAIQAYGQTIEEQVGIC
jgi:hypothetical protein